MATSTFSFNDLQNCTLIADNGVPVRVCITDLSLGADGLPAFSGHMQTQLHYRGGMNIGMSEDERISDIFKTFNEKQRNAVYAMIGTALEDKPSQVIPEITRVIFNDPATIVFWQDGTKTVVKAQVDDEFDPEKGLAMAIVKKVYGNQGNYCNQLKKWLPKEGAVDIPTAVEMASVIGRAWEAIMNSIREELMRDDI